MRAFLMALLTLSVSGCLFGASRGQTTTSYVNDDGIHPVQRTTVTQTSSGTTVGGSVPLVLGGGMMYAGGAFGGATIVGGGYGGGNTACVLHPDRCAVMQTATVYQPVAITSTGGGFVGGAAVTGVGGGRTTMVGPGGAGSYAETDDSELTAMLAKHEKALSVVVGATKQNSRQICQILIANPDTITDPDERKDVVTSCQDYLDKHPYGGGKAKASARKAKLDAALAALLVKACQDDLDDPSRIKDADKRPTVLKGCKVVVENLKKPEDLKPTMLKMCPVLIDAPAEAGIPNDITDACRKLASGEEN